MKPDKIKKLLSPMTEMENIVMNNTGCNRQMANTVVNAILDRNLELEGKDE